MLAYVIVKQRFMTICLAFFYFDQIPLIDGSINSTESFIIIEVQQQIEKMACLQWEWQRSVITSIHNVPC